MPTIPQFRAHPWHGVPIGDDAPETVTCYIEIVPTDTVKFEIDKASGILRVDRPQKFSNHCPSLYGFIPQTFCGDGVGALCAKSIRSKRKIRGDGDPMDICVLTERTILHGDLLVRARPIGGFKLVDRAEADDKIIAVLEGDGMYANITDIREVPIAIIDRLKHYFLTYKQIPGTKKAPPVEVASVYGRSGAYTAIRQSILDYRQLLRAK
jgi:inorganic pyrophosphatase